MSLERGPTNPAGWHKDLRRAAQEFRLRYYGREGNPGPPPAMAELAPEVMQLVDEVVYGEVYNRPAVNLQTRSLCTIAALTVLGHSPQLLQRHILAALHIGVTKEQISEIISQMVFYGGMPAAVNAFRVAKESFDRQPGYQPPPDIPQPTVDLTQPEPPAVRLRPVDRAPTEEYRRANDESRIHRDREHGEPDGRQPDQGRPRVNRSRPASRSSNQSAGDGRRVGGNAQRRSAGQRGGVHFSPGPKGRRGGGGGGKRNTGRRR